MTSVIAVVNQKGGVGKTTTTANLAYGLVKRSKRVLAIDLDPQASLSISAGMDVPSLDKDERTIYFGLVKQTPLAELVAETESFDIIPSSIRLATGETEISRDPLAGPHLLSERLKPLKERYDYVLIDCPPTLQLLTVNALAASDHVIVPVKTDFLSMMGLPLLFDTVAEIKQRANPGLSILGILPTLHAGHISHNQEALDALEGMVYGKAEVFEPIARTTAFDRAPANYQTTLESDPTNKGSVAYQHLADYVIDKT